MCHLLYCFDFLLFTFTCYDFNHTECERNRKIRVRKRTRNSINPVWQMSDFLGNFEQS